MYLSATCIPSLEKCLFKSFAHFKIRIFFKLLNCGHSLYILEMNPLSDMYAFANTFFHSEGCFISIIMIVSSEVSSFLILMTVTFLFLVF